MITKNFVTKAVKSTLLKEGLGPENSRGTSHVTTPNVCIFVRVEPVTVDGESVLVAGVTVCENHKKSASLSADSFRKVMQALESIFVEVSETVEAGEFNPLFGANLTMRGVIDALYVNKILGCHRVFLLPDKPSQLLSAIASNCEVIEYALTASRGIKLSGVYWMIEGSPSYAVKIKTPRRIQKRG